jgi:hypothetical protein
MHLALDWYQATGKRADRGRSDGTGFGELVHSVLQHLEISPGAAAHALRTYWAERPA